MKPAHHPRLQRPVAALLLSLVISANLQPVPGLVTPADAAWARGREGQRRADLGHGTFLNPVMPGDHPDPSVLKVGRDYYMVHSSFDYTPGLMIWHSRDLVNWQPVGPALHQHVGTVWAPDLVRHNDRYYIYFPVLIPNGVTNMVVQADDIRGPWSDPVDLQIGHIDPGHAVGEDGRRYLFLSAGYRVPLADDGLRVTGPAIKVYDGWKYPADWDVETFAQEGPKMLRRGDYYYMVLAEGGTSGPPTSHMVIMARAKSLDGPWENSPHNPIIRTASAAEAWWSRGHATLIEAPDAKQWYLVYHAYENGYYNLGRQTLLEPVEWTEDGWVRATGADVAGPLPLPPGGEAVAHGLARSDDFSGAVLGRQWAFFRERGPLAERYRLAEGSLVLRAAGSSPQDSPVLTHIAGDRAYEMQVEVEIDPGASAGLLVFYHERLFAGIGMSDRHLLEFLRGETSRFDKPAGTGRRFFLRLRNDRHIVTVWHSPDGRQWTRHWMQYEVSGYHHNVGGGFLSLRPALFAAGTGEVRFRHYQYRALP
jgi:beta-xylosidase